MATLRCEQDVDDDPGKIPLTHEKALSWVRESEAIIAWCTELVDPELPLS
ncbi:MAG: hypothetical protein ABI746_01855 [Dermatophilaceae bacterium]